MVATDAAGNESSAQSVTLDINNLDELAPIFLSSSSASVLESAGPDTIVYRALVDDSGDISQGVTFALGEGSDSALSIDSLTGDVTLSDNPNFLNQSEYNFTVVALDGSNSSEKAITLNVVDEDLESPVFTLSLIHI